jgi:hypothetical protein
MEQNLSDEALKQRVTELEERLKEYERKEAKQNIREVTKRLEKIAEMGDDGIIVFDESYKIEFANTIASELTGYSKEKLVGTDFRRLLTEHLDFIDTARKSLEIEDFYDLLNHTILLPKSHGKLGGKSSGLFLASKIIRRSAEFSQLLSDIKIPKTWYLHSDILLQFLIEAITLSLVGGLLGILLGVLIPPLLSAKMGWVTLVSPESVALAFLFSAAIGIFFGYYPARRASLLNVIDALRYE